MNISAGITAAIIALLAWGFGDFFIQRAIRLIGRVESLFIIGIFGFFLLLPFAAPKLSEVIFNYSVLTALLSTILISFIGALILFTSFQRGKLSVVLPVFSIELIFTVLISAFFLHDAISTSQFLLIAAIFFGILLVVIHREHRHWWEWWKKTRLIEKGVVLALIAALFSSFNNVLTAVSSRLSDPIVAIWFIHSGLGILSFFWLLSVGKIRALSRNIRKHWKTLVAQGSLDNIAWIAYAKSVTLLSVAVAAGITEGFIALAVLLGVVVNREKITRNQVLGILITFIAVTLLALSSN